MLVIEDDVDWHIRLRTSQIPAAAAAVRKLVDGRIHHPGPAQFGDEIHRYWGNTSTWDILYLGHCGDIFEPSAWSFRVPRVMYEDPTLPSREQLHPYTREFLEKIGIPESTRMIHKSISPLCTFAFAVSRPAAKKLLEEIAVQESEGGTQAYDVRILEACRDLGFRCYSANPELFHHMDMPSEIAALNTKGELHPDADRKGRLKPVQAGRAPNIACGARSEEFFTRDKTMAEHLRQVVGREGRCIKDEEEVLEPEGKGEEEDELVL
jgi:hypothetical protein